MAPLTAGDASKNNYRNGQSTSRRSSKNIRSVVDDKTDKMGDLDQRLQLLSISLKAAKPTVRSTLLDLPDEIILNIIHYMEPHDLICLALSCHKLHDIVCDDTKKSLKEIAPPKMMLESPFSSPPIVPVHSHCLGGKIGYRSYTFLGGFVTVNDPELMARLEYWFGDKWGYCGSCRRYTRVCRCKKCKNQEVHVWRRRVAANVT